MPSQSTPSGEQPYVKRYGENDTPSPSATNGTGAPVGKLKVMAFELAEALCHARTSNVAPDDVLRIVEREHWLISEALHKAYSLAQSENSSINAAQAGETVVPASPRQARAGGDGPGVASCAAPYDKQEPQCAGPFVDARDCPVHCKDVLGSAQSSTAPMERPAGHDEAKKQIEEAYRRIEILCDEFGYDPAEWLVSASGASFEAAFGDVIKRIDAVVQDWIHDKIQSGDAINSIAMILRPIPGAPVDRKAEKA